MNDYRKMWEKEVATNLKQKQSIECYREELREKLDSIRLLNRIIDGLGEVVDQKEVELKLIKECTKT